MTLVDANVLLDVATNDRDWAEWSVNRLDAAAIHGPLLINAVVYAEFSVGFVRVEEVDRVLDGAGFKMADIPRAALFLAGKVFQRYRARGGTRTGVLPDFFIGAHAAVAQIPLLTRDPRCIGHIFQDSRSLLLTDQNRSEAAAAQAHATTRRHEKFLRYRVEVRRLKPSKGWSPIYRHEELVELGVQPRPNGRKVADYVIDGCRRRMLIGVDRSAPRRR
jgi:predicted nucleic acid-binding protein